MTRLFAGARLRQPPAEAVALLDDVGRLRGTKPVQPSHLHVTLRFLGDVDEALVGPLGDALAAACTGFESVDAELGPCGTFPPRGDPRVVWLGLDERTGDVLRSIADRFDEGCSALGVGARDKPFVPHVTIARARRGHGGRGAGPLREIVAAHAGSHGVAVIKEVQLIASVLTPEGPVYEDVREVPLG